MSILARFSSIMKANINALLDKYEDPSKMIDQYLIDLKGSLAAVKQETAGVMAVEKRCSRQFDENEEVIKKFRSLAKKAVDSGNDGDAKVFRPQSPMPQNRYASGLAAFDEDSKQPDRRFCVATAAHSSPVVCLCDMKQKLLL